ncbi:Uncharacterized membrane-anchored protein [Lutibacter oricola]|uniref:Uncharacterized membrane-anchored protein n=1 Tax=Lutibacter oricola TaxID=762486 RepID=A0A1H2RHB5_9FLAO|nr:GDYXXLXY domain-containing protein [Lutibacter oricola]SDW18846.1 Uncharacterized membrane-anchored protein [Lutibacter oricola]
MKSKIIIFSLFLIVAVAQLFVPFKMISNQEDVLKTGVAFKFKTEPLDPSDPFRGKYIRLNFEEDKFSIQNKDNWTRNEEVYVVVKNDENGFASIKNIVKEKPLNTTNFITAKVKYIHSYKENKNITIEYPFERFYMDEFKAKPAEDAHQESFKKENNTTYALVYLKNGESVLSDVLINNESIKDIVSKRKMTK